MPKILLNPEKFKKALENNIKPEIPKPKGRIYGLDLFSGIGGISLALEPWVQTVCYCEADRHAQAVLLSRMHEGALDIAPIASDIKKIGARNIDIPIDIIFGGFPCQDISTAGLGAGIQGSRSGLFFEIMRLARELGPSFLFLENVAAISSRGLDQVAFALAENGFDARWCCLSASEVGAPHRRERWFCLAKCADSDKEGRGCFTRIFKKQDRKRGRVIYEHIPVGDAISDTDSFGGKKGKPEPKAWGRFANIDVNSWWEAEPNVGRVVDGLPHRMDRNERLGNAVVPLQARKAFELLMFGRTSLQDDAHGKR